MSLCCNLFFLIEIHTKLFLSRNNDAVFKSLHQPRVNTIFDVENFHQNSQQQFYHAPNQVHFDSPPSYSEIVLDIHLINSNTETISQHIKLDKEKI